MPAVKNIDTGKKVSLEDSFFYFAVSRSPEIPLRYTRLDFPFEDIFGGKFKIGDVVVQKEDGNVYGITAETFDGSFMDLEFATPHFREMSKGVFADLMIKRGCTPTDVGTALQIVEDVKQLSDGKKPVYLMEIMPLATVEDMEVINETCIKANLAVLIAPKGFVDIIGEVE